jgi:hypothetical protein
MNIQAGTCVSGVKDKGLQQNSLLRLLIIFPVISAGLSVMNNICGHTLFTSSCIIFFCIFLFIFFSIFYLFIYLFIFFFFFFFFSYIFVRAFHNSLFHLFSLTLCGPIHGPARPSPSAPLSASSTRRAFYYISQALQLRAINWLRLTGVHQCSEIRSPDFVNEGTLVLTKMAVERSSLNAKRRVFK